MANNFSSINLATKKQIPIFDKFMNWALTIGRLIVIVTEIIAISAFIYRFSLDEKLIDLHDEIKNKQTLVSLYKNDESKYRNLQDRIAMAANLSEEGTKAKNIIRDIINFSPIGMKINSLTLNKDKITISINAASISQFSDFISPLKVYPEIKSLSIDSIESKPAIGLLVNISAMLK